MNVDLKMSAISFVEKLMSVFLIAYLLCFKLPALINTYAKMFQLQQQEKDGLELPFPHYVGIISNQVGSLVVLFQ